MKTIRVVFIVMALATITALPAAAKGEFNLVTATGPDWMGEIEITDPELLAHLGMGVFMNTEREISPPDDLGRAYLISRGYESEGDHHFFDRIFYFPGSPSVAYYLEIVNGSGPYDGRWYEVTEAGSAALRAGLTAGGARLPNPPQSLSAEVASSELGAPKLEQTVTIDDLEHFTSAAEQALDPRALAAGAAAIALLGGAVGYGLRELRLRSRKVAAS